MNNFTAKTELKPTNLAGISDKQITQHWKLYEGYVAQTNKLLQELAQIDRATAAHSDRRRRLGFEMNGMVLHELYFGTLKAGIPLSDKSPLCTAITSTWTTFDAWHQDFLATGATRGIGWAMLCIDPASKTLVNIFIADHEYGIIATFKPLLVMDVWEHAYMVDQEATGRAAYMAAFMNNINWNTVEQRFKAS